MKYAVSNWIFLNEQLEKGFRRLREVGYNYLELIGEPRNYVIDTINEFCQYYDLEIFGLLANCQWPVYERDLINPNVQNRTKTIEYVKECLEFGNSLSNCKIFTMSAGPKWKLKPLISIKDEWTYAIEGFRKIGKFAEEYDMVIAIEPLNRYETYFIRNADQVLKLVKEVNMPETIKVCLNTFHMNIEEKDISQAIRKVGNKLANIHLSDSNRGAIGNGNIDWKSVIRALKEIKYDSYLTIEPFIFNNDFIDPSMNLSELDLNITLKDCLSALKYMERIV
ncbi:MAG: sugar phosphate isomerase/epimerase family protein [Candidatus Helarchaeota archaeon]